MEKTFRELCMDYVHQVQENDIVANKILELAKLYQQTKPHLLESTLIELLVDAKELADYRCSVEGVERFWKRAFMKLCKDVHDAVGTSETEDGIDQTLRLVRDWKKRQTAH